MYLYLALINHGKQFDLIVNPSGGEFPYGGTNPFSISFSSDLVKHTESSYPPEPPLPMKMVIPANSRVIFTGNIPLSYYNWSGTPKVKVNWQFFYYEEPYPKGIFTITLPIKY